MTRRVGSPSVVSGLVVGRASYRQAQHLDGSVMGHRWRCNVDNNGARYTGLQEQSDRIYLNVLHIGLLEANGLVVDILERGYSVDAAAHAALVIGVGMT